MYALIPRQAEPEQPETIGRLCEYSLACALIQNDVVERDTARRPLLCITRLSGWLCWLLDSSMRILAQRMVNIVQAGY
jgi:hypothetical protein